MDFYKNGNSKSTHSNHNNSSSSGKKPGNSSYIDTTYNSEYSTLTTSLSPFATSASTAATLCPSSSAKTVVNVAIDELNFTSSSSSLSLLALANCGGVEGIGETCPIAQTESLSPFFTKSYTSSINNMCSSHNHTKRKRRSSMSLECADPEIGLEPPLAKRQQRVPLMYQSDSGSSVYPSPVDILANDIDTRSSSEYDALHDEHSEIPESPNSPLPDSPDSPPSPDRGSQQHFIVRYGDLTDDVTDDDDVISETTSPSACSTSSQQFFIPQLPGATTTSQHYHHYNHHGERTPGQLSANNNNNDTPKVKFFDDYMVARYSCLTPASEPEPPRQCPLPALSWANASDVWQLMCKKDENAACLRDVGMLEQHPGLKPRMRAILLDWLIEVCEVYKLHRETYYLAVDYLDRYLTVQKKVQKTHLQLIGITCLFVAAKVEEIYPPKIGEFAYVTDGACQESDILQHEILLLQALEWNISPVTVMGWMGVYMQLNVTNRTPASFTKNTASLSKLQSLTSESTVMRTAPQIGDDAFIYPQFSGMEFVQTARLLDLCSLDVGIANYSYSVIAAAAISHTFNRDTAISCSGLDWQTLQSCASWMEPFFHVISDASTYLHMTEQNEQLPSKCGLGHICPNIVTDDSHIIQTHTTTMDMFDRALFLQQHHQQLYSSKIKQEASPATGLICPEGLLTPPASSRKLIDCVDEKEERIPVSSVIGIVQNRESFEVAGSQCRNDLES